MNTVKFHYYTKVIRMIRANTLVVDDSRNAVDASLCIQILYICAAFFFLHLIDNNGYQIKVFNERMFALHSKHTFFYILPSSHTATFRPVTYPLTNTARKRIVVKCVQRERGPIWVSRWLRNYHEHLLRGKYFINFCVFIKCLHECNLTINIVEAYTVYDLLDI